MMSKLSILSLCLCFGLMAGPVIAQTPRPSCPTNETGCLYINKSANATTTIKSGAGFLHTITLNTAGATDTITVYDNTAGSGTKIATINAAVTGSYTFDVGFSTGLTIVISGTTAPDVTISYI